MKIAIVMHGNLRTFLMPLRENPNDNLAQRFLRHLVRPNNADVFIYTDTSDFYLDGVQYYPSNRKIEVLNNDSFRIHDKIDFIESEKARPIIQEQLTSLLQSNLKDLQVEDPFDPTTDPKYKFLYDANVIGSSPVLLIHQWRKLKLAYEMMRAHEQANHFNYDIIIKWRFDVFLPDHSLLMQSYDFHNTDVYIAGGDAPIVYDWYSFGKRQAMENYTYLYDKLGMFLNEGRAYMSECRRCNRRSHYGQKDSRPCNFCHQADQLNHYEITLAPEYHLFRLLSGVRSRGSGYPAYPYRYTNTDDKKNINDILKSLDCTLVSLTASRDQGVTKFGKEN